MKNSDIRQAFDQITAEPELKTSTLNRIRGVSERRQKRLRMAPRLASAVCCAALLLLGGEGYQLYFTEASAISIDVNPSIELSLNRFDRVVEVRAFNEDGERLLSSLSLRNKAYRQAIEELLTSAEVQPYLKPNSIINFTLESDTADAETLLQSVEDCVSHTLSQTGDRIQAEYGCADSETREAAHEHGMSVGKYQKIQELLETDPNATFDDFKDDSIQELHDHMDNCNHGSVRKAQGQNGSGNGNATAAGHRGRHGSHH